MARMTNNNFLIQHFQQTLNLFLTGPSAVNSPLPSGGGGGSSTPKTKCSYYVTSSTKCGEVCIPLSKFCVKHILQDTNQVSCSSILVLYFLRHGAYFCSTWMTSSIKIAGLSCICTDTPGSCAILVLVLCRSPK